MYTLLYVIKIKKTEQQILRGRCKEKHFNVQETVVDPEKFSNKSYIEFVQFLRIKLSE